MYLTIKILNSENQNLIDKKEDLMNLIKILFLNDSMKIKYLELLEERCDKMQK